MKCMVFGGGKSELWVIVFVLSQAKHVHGLGMHVHCRNHYGSVLSCGLECWLVALIGV